MRPIHLIHILLVLNSCTTKSPEYKNISKEVKYKYLKFGEGPKVESGKTLMLYLSVLDANNDTLHYVPDYPYFVKVGDHPIDSAFLELGKGDSAHIITSRSVFNTYLKFYKPLQADSGMVELRISIKEVLDSLEASEVKRRLLSERELSEQLELKGFLSSLRDSAEYFDGIYRVITERTTNEPIEYGDQVSISYQGKFLNGYVFDNTDDKGVTPTFRYGEDYQLLEGVEIGLKGMREGESVKIILPSRRAFGEEGSLAGIVPPYTAVIFEIKILKIEK